MIKKREPTQARKLGKDPDTIAVSHNCQDKVLDLLAQKLARSWRIKKIQATVNEQLPDGTGFIYDPAKLIMFKFIEGKFKYWEVPKFILNQTMVKNRGG